MNQGVEFPTEAKKLATDADKALVLSANVIIDSNDSYEQGALIFKEINAKIKEVNDKRLSMTRPLDESKKQIMDFFKGPIEKLESAKKTIKGSMIAYQEKIELERKKEEERLRIAAEKERKYQERLAEKRAARAEEKGDVERAEEIREEIQDVPFVAPVIAANKPKPQGVAIREIYSAEVVDIMALIKAVAEGRAPQNLVVADQKVLSQMARALKNNMAIDGVIIRKQKV